MAMPVAARGGQATLSVARLTMTDFRCYQAARLVLDGRPVVLSGPNGAGKTSVLEAVSFLVPGRGLRRARLTEVGRRVAGEGERAWAVAATLVTPTGPVEIGTGGDEERRLVRIDGVPARGQSALSRHVSAVWLTPAMDRLFLEGAGERRRFLDRLVFGFEPAHAGRVTAYENAMRQRQRLLREGPRDPAWLAALEDQMTTRSVAIAAARLDLARRLNLASADGIGPFPRARVEVQGDVEAWLDGMPALAVEDRLRACLAERRGADETAGGAGIGTHRSDLAVFERGRDLPAARGSTGEQKALLVALVLATARLRTEAGGTPPLLLLDEVAAHLDQRRRRALFEEILALGAQAWLTGTDLALFEPLAEAAQFIRVNDAALTYPENP
ncbi:MAG: DNA replication/repair protein RecF [Alphaproteobacteria bacterium]|nr:DNA replication/repair protein RecF [Alphaproteobacteria bacterium]